MKKPQRRFMMLGRFEADTLESLAHDLEDLAARMRLAGFSADPHTLSCGYSSSHLIRVLEDEDQTRQRYFRQLDEYLSGRTLRDSAEDFFRLFDEASDRGFPEARPFVLRLAELMESRLRDNDHKGGRWAGMEEIMAKLQEEVAELFAEAARGGDDVGGEAADVANLAGILASWCVTEWPHVNDKGTNEGGRR